MNRVELLKNAKPILFNTEMVLAILEGRKTVTRRVVKLKNGYSLEGKGKEITENINLFGNDIIFHNGEETNETLKPQYKVGDILWVRETWCYHKTGNWYGYRADGDYRDLDLRWKPSIHMPKVAARIFLKVTDVRVERLQNISCLDAISEGVKPAYSEYENCNGLLLGSSFEVDEKETIKRFEQLWNSTIKKQDLDKYGWDASPWVWVIEFERVEERK